MIRMTQGELAGLRASAGETPPGTCPQIDLVIDAINEVNKIVGRAPRDSRDQGDRIEEYVSELALSIEMSLWGTLKALGELREQNERLRGLGEFWYGEFKRRVEIAEAPDDNG